jgi:hypothetical protein
MALDLALNPQLEAVKTVTGDGVNNTDPRNPVISFPAVGDIGAVPTSRTITINGTAFDLTADRTWSVGTVLSVTGDGVDNTDPTNPVISLADVAVSGDYGDLLNLPSLFSGDYDDLTNKPSLDFVESVTGNIVDVTDPVNPTIDGFPDYEPSTGDLLFSPVNRKPRKYGFTTARTGNLLIDSTGAKEGVMIKVRHNDTAEPSVSVIGGGVTIIKEGGDYLADENNYIYLICHKDDAGTLTAVSYTINNNQL